MAIEAIVMQKQRLIEPLQKLHDRIERNNQPAGSRNRLGLYVS